MTDTDELVGALAAALEGDTAGFEAALAPGAVIWHNHDRKEIDALENMAGIAMLPVGERCEVRNHVRGADA